MLRIIGIVILFGASAAGATELNPEQVQNCISDSLALKETIAVNESEQKQLKAKQGELDQLHIKLGEQKRRYENLFHQRAKCNDECQHLDAKLKSAKIKFNRSSDRYKRLNKEYQRQLDIYQQQLGEHQTEYAGYQQRCQQAEVSAMDFERYCNSGQHDAPFCQKK